MEQQQSEKLISLARNFDDVMGSDVPFVLAIWNRETEMIEFITNMETEAMESFVHDMADQVETPESYETHPRKPRMN